MDVEKSAKNKLVSYFKQLGLGREQTLVYMFLLESGPQSVLAISRGLKTGRTKLYPLLEALADKQLITVHERHYGASYEAKPPDVLEFLVSEHENAASALRMRLPSAIHTLQSLHQASPATSQLIEYKGIDGLKQMRWNLTKAESEYRVFELAGLNKHLGAHFSDKMHTLTKEKKITTYYLTNDPKSGKRQEFNTATSTARYIDPAVFKIQFETYIYDHCVALVSYKDDDIFGVEVYNHALAEQYKQVHELIWSQAKNLS